MHKARYFHFFRAAIALCLGLLFLCLPFSTGQGIPATSAEENASEADSIDPLKIKISVNEVRIDVVVLDKKTGNPVTELTAADFEVFQDNKRQEIKSSVYVGNRPDADAHSAIAQKSSPDLLLTQAAALKKEDIGRTIVFIVDDLAMEAVYGFYTKMALRGFVEKQMQSGDMVSIIRTDYGNRALNMFQSGKREVLARIDALPWVSRGWYDDLLTPDYIDRRDKRISMDETRKAMLALYYDNQISTVSYGIRGLRDMPGRKIMNILTPLTMNPEPEVYERYRNSYDKLADEALRAGVVINFLDIGGLKNKINPIVADASMSSGEVDFRLMISKPLSPNGSVGSVSRFFDQQARTMRNSRMEERNFLAQRTGGIIIEDSNFFLDGIGREVENLMAGCYLITYVPPHGTFETRGQKDIYRRLKVSVKRKDVVVHTRDGFFGRLKSDPDVDSTKQAPLIDAIYFPYKNDSLNIDFAAGYTRNPKGDYLVRSWTHLGQNDVKIIETEDGGGRIDLEAVILTSDLNGKIHDSKRVEFKLTKLDLKQASFHQVRQ